MIQPPLLSITILSGNRRHYEDLLRITIDSLLYHLIYPHWEMLIYSHSEGVEAGYRKLFTSINGKYILSCEDDYFFFPVNPEYKNWIQTSINILEDNPGIKFVRLRQDDDGQTGNTPIKDLKGGVEVSTSSGFTLNPWIAKTETIKLLLEDLDKHKEEYKNFHFEKKMWLAAKRLDLNGVAKLVFPNTKWHRKGVCLHTGYGRRQKYL